MSAQVIPINRWVYEQTCAICNEPWQNIASCEMCLRGDDLRNQRWKLANTSGMIERFVGGAYYGSWNSGRTGAVADLDTCKRMVEQKCQALGEAWFGQ